MASTISKKRSRRRPVTTPLKGGKAPSTVGEMTPEQLRELIEQVLDERLSDPDEGVQLRPEITERIKHQRDEYSAGKRGKPLEQVMKDYGIE